MKILDYLIYFEAASFLFFGFTCLTTEYMKSEFLRYGLSKQRVFTGVIQLLCSFGLFAGMLLNIRILTFVAALGLFLLMSAGYIVRLKIRDGFVKSFPALFYALLSLYISYKLFAFL